MNEVERDRNLLPYYVSRDLSRHSECCFSLPGLPCGFRSSLGQPVWFSFFWLPAAGDIPSIPSWADGSPKDERTQTINDSAARNGFVVGMIRLQAPSFI